MNHLENEAHAVQRAGLGTSVPSLSIQDDATVAPRQVRYLSGHQPAPKGRSLKALNELLDALRDDAAFQSLGPYRYFVTEAIRRYGDRNNEFWIEQKTWAELVGASEAAIRKAVARARAKGVLVVIEQRRNGKRTNNAYRLADRFYRPEVDARQPSRSGRTESVTVEKQNKELLRAKSKEREEEGFGAEAVSSFSSLTKFGLGLELQEPSSSALGAERRS